MPATPGGGRNKNTFSLGWWKDEGMALPLNLLSPRSGCGGGGGGGKEFAAEEFSEKLISMCMEKLEAKLVPPNAHAPRPEHLVCIHYMPCVMLCIHTMCLCSIHHTCIWLHTQYVYILHTQFYSQNRIAQSSSCIQYTLTPHVKVSHTSKRPMYEHKQ